MGPSRAFVCSDLSGGDGELPDLRLQGRPSVVAREPYTCAASGAARRLFHFDGTNDGRALQIRTLGLWPRSARCLRALGVPEPLAGTPRQESSNERLRLVGAAVHAAPRTPEPQDQLGDVLHTPFFFATSRGTDPSYLRRNHPWHDLVRRCLPYASVPHHTRDYVHPDPYCARPAAVSSGWLRFAHDSDTYRGRRLLSCVPRLYRVWRTQLRRTCRARLHPIRSGHRTASSGCAMSSLSSPAPLLFPLPRWCSSCSRRRISSRPS